jgi:hypothetical protein
MLGSPFRFDITDWPRAGELDAMENINNQPTVYGTLHCGTVQLGGPCHEPTGLTATYYLEQPTAATRFHTYTVVWNTNPEQIRWYVDDKPYLTITAGMIGSSTWRSTFDHGFFILLNVAIGGSWPGNPNAATVSGALSPQSTGRWQSRCACGTGYPPRLGDGRLVAAAAWWRAGYDHVRAPGPFGRSASDRAGWNAVMSEAGTSVANASGRRNGICPGHSPAPAATGPGVAQVTDPLADPGPWCDVTKDPYLSCARPAS